MGDRQRPGCPQAARRRQRWCAVSSEIPGAAHDGVRTDRAGDPEQLHDRLCAARAGRAVSPIARRSGGREGSEGAHPAGVRGSATGEDAMITADAPPRTVCLWAFERTCIAAALVCGGWTLLSAAQEHFYNSLPVPSPSLLVRQLPGDA